MASPPTWRRWPSKTTTTTTNDSAFTMASSSSSCSTSSIFYFSLTKRNRRITRHHLTKFSLDQDQHRPSSSSSPSTSSSSEIRTKKLMLKKKSILGGRTTIETAAAAASSLLKDEIQLNSESVVEKDEENEISSSLNLKKKQLIFKNRPLWRRILFASKKVRSIILLNVIAIVYASNIPVVKEVEAITDPAVFTVVRFAVASIPFLPFVLRARDDVQTRTAGLELGFWVSLGYLMQALGLLTSDAGRASFISLFTVIIVPLLDGVLGATVPVYTWFGALMSLIGVGLLESSGSPPCIGDFWNFLSAVFFGIHMLRTEHISRSTKKENFLALLGYEISVVALFSIVWYLVGVWYSSDPGWDPGSWTWALALDWIVKFPWVPALYTGIFSTGLCLWVEMSAMVDVSATETAIIYGLEPLWGAGFAWILLGERWGIIGWIGAALVLGGSLTVQIFGSLSPNPAKEFNEQSDQFMVSDKRNVFSAAPVVVRSTKGVQDLLNKKK